MARDETRVDRYLRRLGEYERLDFRKSDDVSDEEERALDAAVHAAWLVLEPHERDELRQRWKSHDDR